jgi:hypothetical protein
MHVTPHTHQNATRVNTPVRPPAHWQDGLDYVATWNAGMLQSDDMEEALAARMQKRKPTFSKL